MQLTLYVALLNSRHPPQSPHLAFGLRRHIQRMLTADSVATLVHAFVTSRMDYCNVVLAGAPNDAIINKLQRVMNVSARHPTGTKKFDRDLTQLMHDNLIFHWFDVPQRESSSRLVAAS